MSKRKPIILCIDDHEKGLMARKLLLEERGYEVLSAVHGRTGLQLFIAHPVDTVILDYEMPEMNGDEVASEMKSLKPEVPILLLSGYSSLPEDKREVVDACLSKSSAAVAGQSSPFVAGVRAVTQSTDLANDKSLSARIQTNPLTRYGTSVAGIVGALLIGRALNPALGACSFYVAAFVAVAFSAWYCGLGPSVSATILALVGLKYWFLTPLYTLGMLTSRQVLGITMFLAAAVLIVAMGEARRRENHVLRRGQGELEERVRQRTLELDAANQDLRELTVWLMQSQDDERRRIARELHDSAGQTLAALTMNLTTVVADIEKLAQTGKNASDSLTLVQEMNKEVRTVSYLLHPPLLDEAGLASALRWYVEGFSERSKLRFGYPRGFWAPSARAGNSDFSHGTGVPYQYPPPFWKPHGQDPAHSLRG